MIPIVWRTAELGCTATHHVDISRQRLEVVERQLVHKVARAEDMGDLSGNEQRLELLGQIRLAVRDVEVANHQREHLSPSAEQG